MLPKPDVAILGAGVIGLSLALELHKRGHGVILRDPLSAATQASYAAAGMLAAEDPFNPPGLAELAAFSVGLYPGFLRGLHAASGESVPFQTDVTHQHTAGGTILTLAENSIDPRQLALALVAAVRKAGIEVRQEATGPAQDDAGAAVVVDASGAWAAATEVFPRKGQMLRVQLPAGRALTEVHRSEDVYIVPRTLGPQAGTALIGATVEDRGFNTEVVPEDLADLRRRGAALLPSLPELADPVQTPVVEAWAGLRPATPDGMPLLGHLPRRSDAPGHTPPPQRLIAAGHFRNGILLAPGTAMVMADLIEGREPAVDLSPFHPDRFPQTADRGPRSG